MKFKELCNIFQKIEDTSSRNEMSNILVEVYNSINIREAQLVSYLLLGRVAPMFVSSESNISEKNTLKLLKAIYPNSDVENLRKEVGDIGDVVGMINTNTGGKLNIEEVYGSLWKVINESGTGSATRKLNIVAKILLELSPIESKYYIRILIGNLRLGISIKTILDSLSIYMSGDKEHSKDIERSYGYCTDIGYLVSRILKEKDDIRKVTDSIDIVPGIPVLPKLVQRVPSFEEGVQRMEKEFVVQPKYDGLRCQIHKYRVSEVKNSFGIWYEYKEKKDSNISMFGEVVNNVEVRLFTRNLEDITDMFPEIVQSVKELKCESCVLDSEIVGWDSKRQKFMSYQDTMTRRRKYDVNQNMEIVPVNSFIFDVLYLNDTNVARLDLKSRLEVLNSIGISNSKSLQISPVSLISTVDILKSEFEKYIGENLEGVIIKKLDTEYTPGVRDYDWIKIKKSIDNSLVDTLDLVVLGYYKGSGKRAEYGIGAILCGIYNESEERFESFTKVGTGITDEQLKTIFERLESIKVEKMSKNVVCEDVLIPDVWVYPEVVVTVSADEISKNRGDNDIAKGYSLRFPRLIEWDRVDKQPYDVFKVEELG